VSGSPSAGGEAQEPATRAAVDLGRMAADAVPAGLLARLEGARRVLVVSHEHPDADTLGAALALRLILERLGGRATLVCADPVPALYRFLPGIEAFRTEPDPGSDYDLLVLVDCAADDRIGPIADRYHGLLTGLPRLAIDHHASNDGRGPDDWVDPGAAATCELIALIATRLGIPLDAGDGALATVLMAGVVMDTATFAHPNATPRTLGVSAALVAAGAPLSEISRRLYRTKPDAQLRLFGRVLDRLATTPDRRVIWSTLLLEDLALTGALAAHSEGIIDLLAQSESAEVAILFKEEEDGTTRVSVRTKPGGVDATVLTGAYGGGGHTRAAGATVGRPVQQAPEDVLRLATRLANEVAR
jgi:phosphoesterase RecJ-like protein